MIKTLVVAFAMLAVSAGFCAAQVAPAAVEIRGGDGRDRAGNEKSGEGGAQPASDQPPDLKSNPGGGVRSGEDAAAENELLESINKSRELAGATPLRLEEGLREAARGHAQRMVASGLFEHQLPGEPPLLERITPPSAARDGLKIDRAGENIANAAAATNANDVLMRSAPHRKNRLDVGFNVAGVAAVWSEGRLYVVEDFAHEVPSYSAEQSGKRVGQAVAEMRQREGLRELDQLAPPNLDEAACSLARENGPNAHLLATAYDNQKTITYTQSRPEVLPASALRMLRDPGLRQYAVGSCYARNTAHPAGMYWVVILLY